MSRTIRRTGKACDSKRKKYHTHTEKYGDWIQAGNGQWHYRCLKQVPLSPEEFKRGFWKYHGDGRYYSERKHYKDWGQVRVANHEDLTLWFKNENHECIFVEEINKRDYN